MFENKKLLWIIGGGVIIVALLVFIIAWKLGKKNTVVMPVGLTQITTTENRPIGLVVNDNGEALYFDGVKKTFYKNKDAISKALEIEITNNAGQVKWSKDFNYAIIRTLNGNYYYSFQDKKLFPLDPDIKDLDFKGDKVITLISKSKEHFLAQNNLDTTGFQKLMNIEIPASNLVLSPNQKYAFISDGTQYQILDLDSKTALNKPTYQQVKSVAFNPSGELFAIDNGQGSIAIVNTKNAQRKTINLASEGFYWFDDNSFVFARRDTKGSSLALYTIKGSPAIKTLAASKTQNVVPTNLFVKGKNVYFFESPMIYSLELK